MYKPIMHAKNTVISDVLGVLTDGEHMPENASFHMTPDEFRRHGKAMVDWIADYYERIESYPVLSQVKSGEIRASLPKNPPAQGEPFESLLGDVAQKIMPGVTHWQSPNFFAYFPSNASFPSILGELLSAGLDVRGMLWATSPACTELETHVLAWLVDKLRHEQSRLQRPSRRLHVHAGALRDRKSREERRSGAGQLTPD